MDTLKMYNSVLGMGRDVRSVGVRTNTTIIDTSFDLNAGASPPSNTNVASLPNNNQIFAVSITAKPQDRTQSSTNAKLKITLNDAVVAEYICPAVTTAGQEPSWQVNEIVPYSYLTTTDSRLFVTLSADNGGTTGYIMEISITALGIEI